MIKITVNNETARAIKDITATKLNGKDNYLKIDTDKIAVTDGKRLFVYNIEGLNIEPGVYQIISYVKVKKHVDIILEPFDAPFPNYEKYIPTETKEPLLFGIDGTSTNITHMILKIFKAYNVAVDYACISTLPKGRTEIYGYGNGHPVMFKQENFTGLIMPFIY